MSGPGAGKTILIVDDDEDLSFALTRILTAHGYRVRRAAEGDEGVRLAAEIRPDLILLDYMMPVKNGFDACQEIRRSADLRDVPIIAFTAFGQDIGEIYGISGKEKALVQGFLEKPVEPNVFLERIADALSAAGAAC